MTPAAPITRVRWRPWRIPLRDPVETATGALVEREGVVVRIETADGAAGLGESAPLPGEGIAMAALTARVDEVAPSLPGLPPGEVWSSLPLSGEGGAPVDVGIETALADLLARECGVPLARWLAERAGLPPPPLTPIVANALIGAADPAAAAREADAATASGFATFKLKVGHDHARDGERLRAVRAALDPEAAIRIDANGAWSESEALAALAAHAAHGIALCEQPVAPGLDAASRLARVRHASPVPIAADESCASRSDLQALIAAGAVDAAVAKPLRMGLAEVLTVIGEARAQALPCILTTTFDSGVGTALALHLAALLPEPRPACGVATLPLLAGDIVRGCPAPEAGVLDLPARTGLGVTLDEAALDRYATAPWAGVP